MSIPDYPDDIRLAAEECVINFPQLRGGDRWLVCQLISRALMARDERSAVMAEHFAQECEDDGRFTACADFLRLATSIRTPQEQSK